MREERIELSQREQDRLKVLHQVEQGYLTQVEAGRRVQVSVRHLRRLLRRVRAEGDRGVVHRLRGRPSNRKIPAALQGRILAQVRRRYADFGPTLASEHLARDGWQVSRETLRQWMTAAGLWRSRRQRRPAVHVWRERRAAFGELVMMDSSPYRWLERRGPPVQLIALIDDATSRVWGRFAAQDSTGKPAHPGRLAPALGTAAGTLYRQKQPVPHHPLGPARRAARRSAGPHPDRAGPAGVGDRVDSRPQPPGQGAHRETIRHLAGPPGQGDAPGRGAHGGAGQPLPGSSLPAFLGAALHRRSAPRTMPTARWEAPSGWSQS